MLVLLVVVVRNQPERVRGVSPCGRPASLAEIHCVSDVAAPHLRVNASVPFLGRFPAAQVHLTEIYGVMYTGPYRIQK